MRKTMKVAVMTGNNKMEFVQRDIPVPSDNQVLVKIEYVGICGSDMHIFESDWGKRVVKPLVLGHESGGTVTEIGKNVKDLKVGDRVALEPGIFCGSCEFCASGRYNLCRDMRFFGAPIEPIADGVFLEYVAHPANLCFKLPDNVSTLEGALIEPFAVGFHAANQGEARPGKTAVVIGTGCIGLMSIAALRICGVAKTYAVDVMDLRLDMARKMGATAGINPAKTDPFKEIMALTGGNGCDLVIDTSGHAGAIGQAVAYMKKGAVMVFVGYSPDGSMTLPFRDCINKELILKTVFRYRNIYPMAIESVAAGLVDLKGMVSKIYPLDDISAAMEENIKNKATLVKSVIKVG